MKTATASFGITALNELQELYNGKSLAEDGQFALETLQYINDKVEQFKNEDGNLYAIYGTPAESLVRFAGQSKFRKKYGIIEGVSDRPVCLQQLPLPRYRGPDTDSEAGSCGAFLESVQRRQDPVRQVPD